MGPHVSYNTYMPCLEVAEEEWIFVFGVQNFCCIAKVECALLTSAFNTKEGPEYLGQESHLPITGFHCYFNLFSSIIFCYFPSEILYLKIYRTLYQLRYKTVYLIIFN